MKIPKMLGILQKINIPQNKYISGNQIKEIILNNGEIIVPSFETLRFNFTNKNIKLKYGTSTGYGSIIVNPSFSFNGKNCSFTKIYKSVKQEKLIFPKPGDIFSVMKNNKVIFSTMIKSSIVGYNGTIIELSKAFDISIDYTTLIFSYYSIIDNTEYDIKGENGLYLKFNPINKKEYQRKIKYKQIKKIITKDGVSYD